MARKGGLGGKGLGALIPDIDENKVINEIKAGNVTEVEIDMVSPNKDQPRKKFDEEKLQALADSIEVHGIVSPLIVVKKDNYYMIVAGERRYRAARLLKLKTVPVIVKDYDELKAEEIALVENLQRENLNPVEEALGYKSLMDNYGLTQEEVSGKVSKSRPQIANMLRILTLPEEILKLLENGKLTTGHAKVLAGLSKEEALRIGTLAANGDLSVRQIEFMSKAGKKSPKKKPDISRDIENAINDCKNNIQKKYGVKVKLEYTDKFKGKISMSFSDYEQMTRLMNLLEE